MINMSFVGLEFFKWYCSMFRNEWISLFPCFLKEWNFLCVSSSPETIIHQVYLIFAEQQSTHSINIFLKVIKHPELPVGDAGHLAPVSLRVVVEVPGVAIVTNFGHDGRLQLFVVNLLPVNILEPSGKWNG